MTGMRRLITFLKGGRKGLEKVNEVQEEARLKSRPMAKVRKPVTFTHGSAWIVPRKSQRKTRKTGRM